MIYLVFCILSSTGIFVFFKLFKKYDVNTLQAIVVNYITAFICGITLYDGLINLGEIINSSWFYGAVGLGFLFILIFNVMALTAQTNGLSVASVASKMSVIIPIVFGIIVFKESAGFIKLTGIFMALVAVYLTSVRDKDNVILTQSIYLPILLFFGSGTIDTLVNYFAPDDKIPLFSATIFAMAFFIGMGVLIFNSIKQKSKPKFKSIPFGMALGILNYASIYYLLKALRVDGYETSTVFTIINVGIVAFSTLVGLFLFKEKISKKNWAGIFIAMISIIIVTLA
ncbi:EamA/RhaT family transporter [Winogradskyella alexanderae]|uniref:EamA/RhaT family transporter n=1 Tax=Winogradskyella alexanderae TaxID=2877123 RepID=A0ABS7XSS5_9FLAO|nr:EamA/RhaT family transporter [Winogradskyella alexanderae]MCA0133060.1 EamA/RhaT family transporter [Winogradskyella alexanderae]